MEEHQPLHRYIKGLNQNRFWIYIIVVAGLVFLALMFRKVADHLPVIMKNDPVLLAVMLGLLLLALFRYFLFFSKQLTVLRSNKNTDAQKIRRFYTRSLYFWITDALVTVAALVFFLLLLYSGF